MNIIFNNDIQQIKEKLFKTINFEVERYRMCCNTYCNLMEGF